MVTINQYLGHSVSTALKRCRCPITKLVLFLQFSVPLYSSATRSSWVVGSIACYHSQLSYLHVAMCDLYVPSFAVFNMSTSLWSDQVHHLLLPLNTPVLRQDMNCLELPSNGGVHLPSIYYPDIVVQGRFYCGTRNNSILILKVLHLHLSK